MNRDVTTRQVRARILPSGSGGAGHGLEGVNCAHRRFHADGDRVEADICPHVQEDCVAQTSYERLEHEWLDRFVSGRQVIATFGLARPLELLDQTFDAHDSSLLASPLAVLSEPRPCRVFGPQ